MVSLMSCSVIFCGSSEGVGPLGVKIEIKSSFVVEGPSGLRPPKQDGTETRPT